ncbi:MAG: hypothetical protein AB7L84_00100 [Acidimicrobiia bacterium]
MTTLDHPDPATPSAAARSPLIEPGSPAGRWASIGALIGFAVLFGMVAALGLGLGMDAKGAIGLGVFVGVWGGLGYGFMMGGCVALSISHVHTHAADPAGRPDPPATP